MDPGSGGDGHPATAWEALEAAWLDGGDTEQRWRAALAAMAASGWPVGDRARWRLGEATVPWDCVAPS